MSLPLLEFGPLLREYIWGGRRLAELGKPIGSGEHYAESWEVVDHGEDQSIVCGGKFQGMSLHDLLVKHGQQLLGRHYPQRQFPLLFKYLDCQRTLSVQVHPNDEQGSRLSPPDLGKTEAWVVLATEPGSRIYAGLKPGTDRVALERAVHAGHCEECLYDFEPRVGNCLLIEAGTVHALGAGLLVAEIQQASNTTFRLYDWNRMDAEGKPRALHVEQSLETIDYARGPVEAVQPREITPGIQRLVWCDKFVLDRHELEQSRAQANDDRFHILSVIEGDVVIRGVGNDCVLRRGGTVLVPACCAEFQIVTQSRAVVLDMYLP